MTRALQALTADPWAIVPGWLPLIAALAQRNHGAPEVANAGDWEKREYDIMAGPGGQRLAGAQRAFVVDGVAILPVVGPIFPRANMMTEMSGATSVTMLQNDYRTALASSDVGAIMLMIDSPGGAVSGISAFADTVAAGTKKKHTLSFVSGQACSAAYWIATAASEVAIDKTGLVGSIGVVIGMSKQVEADRDGYLDVEIVSTNAPNKRPDPTAEDGVAEIIGTLDAIEKQFVSAVARGRNVSVDKVLSDFGKGGVKVGSDAVSSGMADRVQSYDAALLGLRRMVANQKKLDTLKQ